MSTTPSREVRLGRLFVRLADNLVSEFDVVDLLDELVASCVGLLDVSAAGLMLADSQGRLQVMAATSEQTRLLELFELQNQQGPCLDCYRSGEPITAAAPDEQSDRWPILARRFRELGFGPVYALPLRLRDRTIGALNLFQPPDTLLSDDALQIGQAMADVATITLLQHESAEASERLTTQLQTALNSRITIEQAKGILAQYARIDMDQAFQLLRNHARTARAKLTDVAAGLATGQLDPGTIAKPSPKP
ncbi:GAF and ANTAR domain-containing protein [Microlunatus sp. GCM10028923]|uniref:GAF and ANTAR domain-containing protein n=1 Tax=Microlunatus sp. GCM10028923 TaxID=3273400 RepID=UPI00361A7DEC